MVAETVEHSIATRALQVLIAKRYPEPALKHDPEKGRLVAKLSGLGRCRVEPEACSTGRHQLEVRAPSLVSCFLRGKLTKRALVNGERQHLLLQVTQRRSSEALVVVDAVVVGPERLVLRGVPSRLESVVAVQLPAEVVATAAGSQKGCVAVLSKGPQSLQGLC